LAADPRVHGLRIQRDRGRYRPGGIFGDDSDRDVIWIMALCAVVIAAALGLHPVIRRHTDCSITLAEWRARRQK